LTPKYAKYGEFMPKTRALSGDAVRLAASGIALLVLAACGGDRGTISVEAHNEFLRTYCMDCHNREELAGDIAFDTLDLAHVGDLGDGHRQIARQADASRGRAAAGTGSH
jgi:hypothetical protein